jgi:hypothetical protein
LVWLVIFNPSPAPAQQQGAGPAGAFIQVPQQLYVGDRGRLIITLEPGFPELSPFVASDPRQLPQGPDLKIHRLEMDRLRGQERLLVDFTAYVPGQIELPPVNISQIPGFSLQGYQVTVASILGGGDSLLVLANPASPLAVPGTSLLIYGTSSLIVFTLLFILGVSIWGRPYLSRLLEAHRRRRLIRLMRNIEKRLRGKIPRGAYTAGASYVEVYRAILRELSAEFRAFLGYFFDRDCRAMTAAEFFFLPPLFSLAPEDAGAERIAPAALGSYFHLLDRLRFSGETVGTVEVSGLLDQLDLMLDAMDAGCREGQGKSPAMGPIPKAAS